MSKTKLLQWPEQRKHGGREGLAVCGCVSEELFNVVDVCAHFAELLSTTATDLQLNIETNLQ